MSRVVVLGGGPAGLYAGLLLARHDIPVTVLEREPFSGGLTAGTKVAGMSVDYGSHRLHPSIDDDILTDLRSLLGEDLQVRKRNGRIHLDGAWISFPISPTELATRLRPSTLARLGVSAARAVVTPNRSGNFADVVSTGLGRAMGEIFYFPYARKIWGVEPELLSGEQARRRISADSPGKLIRKAISGGSAGFYYPKRGFGQIAAALHEAAVAAGADVRLGSAVTSINGRQPDLEVGTTDGPIRAGLILSTIPVTVLARLLEPPPPIESGLGALRYRAMVLVYLTVPAAQWTPFDAHYFPAADITLTRISEPKNYRDGDDPADTTVLCAEVPCDPDDETWQRPDRELAGMVRDQLVQLDLRDPGTEGTVRRIRHVYPVYGLGAEDAFGEVAAWLDTKSGIVTFGRQGLFAHDNTHHALAMARDAVACVSPTLDFDTTAWDQARDRFARHVVED